MDELVNSLWNCLSPEITDEESRTYCQASGLLPTDSSGLELYCSDDGWLELCVAPLGSSQLCFGCEETHLSPAPGQGWKARALALSQVPVSQRGDPGDFHQFRGLWITPKCPPHICILRGLLGFHFTNLKTWNPISPQEFLRLIISPNFSEFPWLKYVK